MVFYIFGRADEIGFKRPVVRIKTNSMRLTLGEKFRLLREKAQKDEREIAEILKLSLSTYIKIEDDFVYPTDGLIARAAKLYGLDYDSFLETGEE